MTLSVIASAAKQPRGRITWPLGCFVARAPNKKQTGIMLRLLTLKEPKTRSSGEARFVIPAQAGIQQDTTTRCRKALRMRREAEILTATWPPGFPRSRE